MKKEMKPGILTEIRESVRQKMEGPKKASAVDWLVDQLREIDENIDIIFDGVIASELIKRAKEMEKWQRMKFEIPELSDEEINNYANSHFYNGSTHKKTWVAACKWYREQLKQRL